MHDLVDRPDAALSPTGWRRERGQPSLLADLLLA